MTNSILQNKLLPKETYIFGTADLNGLIDEKFGDYQYGISVGKRLDDKIIDSIANGPTIEYYEYYNQINKELAEKAKEIKNELRKINIDSIVIEPTVSTEFMDYLKTLTVDISHKMVATRTGLGWIGKTDLFISTRFGSRLRLVSILLNKNPDIDSIPIEESRCGKCNICVEKCPAQAANGELWNIKVHRDDFFDAYKCREKCGEIAKQRLNIDIRICGLCISVCPIGKKDKKFMAANKA
ncbi:Epoxyqueuosine reductase [subsurface metagenome]